MRRRADMVRSTAVSTYAGRRVTLAVLCSVFMAAGIVMAALGPILPDLARQTGRTLSEVGRAFIAIFGGSLLAQILAGPISDRFGRRIVLVAGLALCAIGAAGLAGSHRMLWLLVSSAIFGLGYGGCTLAVNVMASELVPGRRASTVNLVNLFYAVGAIAGPLLAGATLEWFGSALPAIWVASALLLVLTPIGWRSVSVTMGGNREDAAPSIALGHAMPFIVSLGLLLSLYVGSEASLGAWAPVYLQRSTSLDAAGATTSTAAFWLALCLGRVFGTVAGIHMTAERLLTFSLIGAAVGGAALVGGHGSTWVSIVALSVLGFTFGPIYPTGMAIVTDRFPLAAGAAASRIGLLAALGGMVFPWLQGLVLTHEGTLPSALVALTILVAMLGMWRVVRAVDARRA
jgi:fucose permease